MEYFLAWWNLENLFDVEDSEGRPEWLRSKLAKELAGWTEDVLDLKIAQLVSIISKMKDSDGPDLLGICEVENESVVKRLVDALNVSLDDRKYSFVHSNTKDARGIDIAFIYDSKLFYKPYSKHIFNHVVLKRNATRDILQVNFRTKGSFKSDLVLIGNHWPSKLGGDLTSEPYRILAAETLSYWMERIYEKLGNDVPVVVMGDFNDEPFNRSITDYALALKDSTKVRSTRSQKPYLYNLMWDLQNDGNGTHYYDAWAILDQIMVNRPLLRSEGVLGLVDGSCEIFVSDHLLKSKKPRRFGRPSKAFDPAGYSDHLPVVVRLARSD